MKASALAAITLSIAFFATIGTAQTSMSTPDMTACHYTPDARQSWKDMWARQLRVLDPAHAQQLTTTVNYVIDGQVDALKAAISGGLNPNVTLKSAGGELSLLELAVSACQPTVARELVTLGASADGEGLSAPIVVAAAKGQDALVEFLIEHGARVDKVDEQGHTALEDAVRLHQLMATRILLNHGANPSRALAGRATILDLAAHSADATDQAIATELRAHGAALGLAGC